MANNKSLDEKNLANKAYAGYLAGRLAGAVTADSPARTALVARYSTPSRLPCEVYTFIVGLREAGCPIQPPDELLTGVYRDLGIGDEVAS